MTTESRQNPSASTLLTSPTERTSSVPCGICRRQFARYTCPKCNLQYCSLTCFRSQTHSDCSEQFYKNELEADIRTNPSQTADERRQMMSLLKRFEEEAAEDEETMLSAENADEDGEGGLAQRIATLNLDDVTYDQMWEVLTPAERQKFLGVLNDPSSEVAQAIMQSEDLEEQIIQPWWEAPVGDEKTPSRIPQKRYGHRPQMFDIPPTVLSDTTNTASTGPSLLFNIFAVLLAYSYVTRTLSTSPLSSIALGDQEYAEARRLLSKTVPFLTSRRSKTVLPSLSGLITDVWSRFDSDTMVPAFFALLIRDAARLLRPQPVVFLPEASSGLGLKLNDHPCSNALLALSDVSSLFQSSPRGVANTLKPSPPDPTVAKLAFYAARIITTSTSVLRSLCDEALARADLLEREGAGQEGLPLTSAKVTPTVKPRIEELA
ncbi:hypothetical protein BC835DRAFT_1392190 [Cytidiella melzeri]|nr:hypothetical protein BC835DRAFT_1392190 [Cytidiella melzeri]